MILIPVLHPSASRMIFKMRYGYHLQKAARKQAASTSLKAQLIGIRFHGSFALLIAYMAIVIEPSDLCLRFS